MKKIFLFFCLILIIGFGVWAGLRLTDQNQTQVASVQITDEPQISPVGETEATLGIPNRIRISELDLDVPIEQVGKDSQGRMDVPKDWNNTGWYMYGPKPGEIGNSAIAGHVDDPKGNPSVFAKLDTLETDDIIVITDQNGKNLEFKVVDVETVELSKFPGDKVFGETDKKHLNLITCGGEWDKEKKEYTERTIVYSELVD